MITDIRERDGMLYGKILGDIEIYGTDLKDLKVAGKEAMMGFIVACELYGEGIEKELLKAFND